MTEHQRCVVCDREYNPNRCGCEFHEVVNKTPLQIRIVFFCCSNCLDTFIRFEGHTKYIKNARLIGE